MGRNKKNIKHPAILLDGTNSHLTEQYKIIRTNIEFSAGEGNLKTFFITSPGPGEGKSMTAANLAIVFAEQKKKVILVDADMRKPTLHYIFSLNPSIGLSNFLAGYNYSISQVIQPSPFDCLDIITSGPVPPNPAELLGGKFLGSMLNELKSRYDLIIFDTPPVLSVSDSQLLAPYMKEGLLVVRNKKTKREEAKQAKKVLLHSRARILGVVLNATDKKRNKNYYYT